MMQPLMLERFPATCFFRRSSLFLFLLTWILSVPASVFAQEITGTILGTVRDSTGQVLPGVQITITSVERGFSRTVLTNDSGDYRISFLTVGEYAVSAELPGFKKGTRTGIVVRTNEQSRVDFTLQVGEITEEITVEAREELLKTTTSDLGEVIDNQRVVELPLNGRQFVQLALLSQGSTTVTQGSFPAQFGLAGTNPVINGNREDANNFILDGVPIIDRMWNNLGSTPSTQAIEEFKVQSFVYGPEFSGGGAQVNISLKSGTNDFHGELYEFIRNDALDARNFFDGESVPEFKQNQFGGSLGGPIVSDRTFFFFNYEGFRKRKGVPTTATVPIEALRSGDFSGFGPIIDPLTSEPFPENRIPEERISPVAGSLLDQVPLPTVNEQRARNFSGSGNQNEDIDQWNTRIDHQISEKDQIFGHFTVSNINRFEPVLGNFRSSGALPPAGFGQNTELDSRNVSAQWTRVFSENLVNQFRFGFSYVEGTQSSENSEFDSGQLLGIEGLETNPIAQGVSRVAIQGFSDVGDPTVSLNWNNKDFYFIDDVSYMRGNHSVKFGVNVGVGLPEAEFFLFPQGNFNFQNTFTGNSFADFLLGLPTFGLVGTGDTFIEGRQISWGFYVQDSWKITPKFTLNLGVRYELIPPVTDTDGRMLNGRLSNLDRRDGSFVVPGRVEDIPASLLDQFPGITFKSAEEAGFPSALIETDTNNIAPRIGFAWNPVGKTVVRAGAGIFYNTPTRSQIWGVLSFDPPFFNLKFAPNDGTFNIADVFTAPGAASTIAMPTDKDFVHGKVFQWSLNLQQQLSDSLLLDIIYLGSRGLELERGIAINQARLGPGPISERVSFPQLGANFDFKDSIANSKYHALGLRLTHRFARGLSSVANYTFGKSLDTASLSFSAGASQRQPQNVFDESAEFGRSDFDQRHKFVWHGTYDLPLPRRTGFVGKLLEGWQSNWILTLQSNKPLTAVLAQDRSSNGVFNDRPNLVGDPNEVSDRSADRFFNTDAFELQPAGQFGSAGRNIIDGPDFKNLDFALVKRTQIKEGHQLEFRAEFFNILNRTNFQLPNPTFDSPDFGVIFQAFESREIQFALRYSF